MYDQILVATKKQKTIVQLYTHNATKYTRTLTHKHITHTQNCSLVIVVVVVSV